MRKFLLSLLLLPSLLMGVENFMFMSVPKCGTNLLNGILQDMSGLQWAAKYNPDISQEVASSVENNQFLFRHLISQDHLDYLIAHDYKFIFLYRDPRDQLISYIFWMTKMVPDYAISKIEGIENQITAMLSVSPNEEENVLEESKNISHDCSYGKFYRQCKLIPKENLMKVKFEDLIGKKGGGNNRAQMKTLKRIANFLDIDISRDRIKEIIDERWGHSGTFRQGEIGEWKKYFTPEHIQMYKEKYGRQLIRLGYEKDCNW